MTVSISNKGNEHNWNKGQERRGLRDINLARDGTCEGREGSERPGVSDKRWEPERQKNIRGVLVYEVGHPIVVCQAVAV